MAATADDATHTQHRLICRSRVRHAEGLRPGTPAQADPTGPPCAGMIEVQGGAPLLGLPRDGVVVQARRRPCSRFEFCLDRFKRLRLPLATLLGHKMQTQGPQDSDPTMFLRG